MLEYQLVENIAAELTSLPGCVAGRVMDGGILQNTSMQCLQSVQILKQNLAQYLSALRRNPSLSKSDSQ